MKCQLLAFQKLIMQLILHTEHSLMSLSYVISTQLYVWVLRSLWSKYSPLSDPEMVILAAMYSEAGVSLQNEKVTGEKAQRGFSAS